VTNAGKILVDGFLLVDGGVGEFAAINEGNKIIVNGSLIVSTQSRIVVDGTLVVETAGKVILDGTLVVSGKLTVNSSLITDSKLTVFGVGTLIAPAIAKASGGAA
jgi:hypothetical protein